MKTMKRSILSVLYIVSATLLVMTGCKAPALTMNEKLTLPDTYLQAGDSGMARMSWRDFFPDELLRAYIDTALANNHSFLQTVEHVSMARSQVRLGTGALLPDVSLGLGIGVQRFGDYTMDGVGNSTSRRVALAQVCGSPKAGQGDAHLRNGRALL